MARTNLKLALPQICTATPVLFDRSASVMTPDAVRAPLSRIEAATRRLSSMLGAPYTMRHKIADAEALLAAMSRDIAEARSALR